MIRPGFLTFSERCELVACVRSQREDQGIARRANAILLVSLRRGPSGGANRAVTVKPRCVGDRRGAYRQLGQKLLALQAATTEDPSQPQKL